MGKISPVSTKYVIYADISIEGLVDRPDVIGAVFGQTEGFLGQDLELRELQRSGKVGRIEVKTENINGKSIGQITIPCSIDKAETAIISASLETIERIGPCNAKVKIAKIEDVRVLKRDFVIARAKELLMTLQSSVLPDSQEMTEEVAQSVRVMEICEWGVEKLSAGPSIDDSEEIIVVEGRADVLNLLKCGFKNAIAINGTNVPDSIKDLCRKKTTTVFVDGDRGGDLILKEFIEGTEIDFITKAPAGKEVEELTKKEIHICLRAKIAAEQFKFDVNGTKKPQQYHQPPRENYVRRNMNEHNGTRTFRDQRSERSDNNRDIRGPTFSRNESQVDPKIKESFKKILDDLIGTRGACILDKECNILGKVPTSEIVVTIRTMKNVFAVIFDGVINKDITSAADSARLDYVVATSSRLKPGESKTVILTPKDL